MGREIRRTPLNWEHPVYEVSPYIGGPNRWDWTGQGRHFVPMFDESISEAQVKWDAEAAEWNRGEHEHQQFSLVYHTPGKWSRDQDTKTWIKSDDGDDPKPYTVYAADGETVIEERFLRDMADLIEIYPYEGYAGERPTDNGTYHPDWGDVELGYQFYETVSEGTPLSPPFATLAELSDFLVNKLGYDKQVADSFCEDGWAPSMVISGGTIYKDIESSVLHNKAAS